MTGYILPLIFARLNIDLAIHYLLAIFMHYVSRTEQIKQSPKQAHTRHSRSQGIPGGSYDPPPLETNDDVLLCSPNEVWEQIDFTLFLLIIIFSLFFFFLLSTYLSASVLIKLLNI